MHKTQYMADALFSAVLHQDKALAMHMCRVGTLSERIAEKLELSPEVQNEGFLAGLLHDVGKIALPPMLLLRQGPLRKPEFDLIKTHAQVGADILSKIDFPQHLVEAVKYHHEKLDGSGYFGITELPCLAKIVAVADVYDALTAFRPYKVSLSKEVALNELRNPGKFDASVVFALEQVLSEYEHLIQSVEEHTDSCFRCAIRVYDELDC